jgi:putative DNA primase/helicase
VPKADFIQIAMGYGITGEICEEIFLIFTGMGRNFKGVLCQSASNVMGPFYVDMNSGLIVDRQVANMDAERCKLSGARIAMFNELRPGDKLKTDQVQLLSGGDGIPVAAKYQAPTTIKPRHQCILSTNHLPEITEVIPALLERIVCITFPVLFTDLEPGEEPTLYRRQKDPTLKARLAADKAGVLNWLVKGAVKWYATRNLRASMPASVKEATRQYMEDQDSMTAFIHDRCEVGPDLSTPAADMLSAYNAWAFENDLPEISNKKLSKQLQDKGFGKKKDRVQVYMGIKADFALQYV